MKLTTCPLCGRDDAIAAKDQPRFYVGGRLTAMCFHGHDGRGAVLFDAETGSLLHHKPMEPHELLYRAAEADTARGYGGHFLAEHCGIYTLSRKAIQQVQPIIPTEKDWIRAQQQDGALTVAPIYRGAGMVGLEVRIVEVKNIGKTLKWTRTLGEHNGVYIANPALQPEAVILFEGIWDAVAGAWDAFEAGEPHRYGFAAVTANTPAETIQSTLQAHFPGIPVLILMDQDGPGKAARMRLAKLGTLACLKGCGRVKDYRDAEPKKRYEALLEAIESSLNAPKTNDEHGNAKIARRALEGALKAKRRHVRDLEAWRFGQRCAGICVHPKGGRRFFAIRARINGQMPVAEGLFDFNAILAHPRLRDIKEDYPDLAAAIEGGPTESHVSPNWLPPQFLEDGRHWTELAAQDRGHYARERGWEPWTGKDPGPPQANDLPTLVDQMRAAYCFVCIPGVPDSEVGIRVLLFCLASALSALWAEERWQAGLPTGFLPITWFFGGAMTGKGTAAKVTALLVAGDSRTYGSQRFDGAEGGWLTESVLHHPVCFRDELDQFLNAAQLEDLKTYASGEPLQLRKKFGTDMTIAPKPVVFSSNSLKINEDDDATKDRINIIQLEPNPLSTKQQRNGAFDRFYTWLDGGGRQVLYRAGIALYRHFRRGEIPPTRWTRSQVFDAAMAFACARLGVDPDGIMGAAQTGKESAIRQGLPWFQMLQEYIHHDLAQISGYHEVKATQVWRIDSGESAARKLRRWIEQFEKAVSAEGFLGVDNWKISLAPRTSSTLRNMIFRREDPL